MKRILVIASYNGPRNHPEPPGYELLEAQLWSLNHFKHNLDKIVVVSTSQPEDLYGVVLSHFETVLYRENTHGSYGSWNLAWDTYGDEFDWYFLIEDDYVFVLDDWDQKLIDLWKPGMGYLCSLLASDHASMSGGLVSSAGFAAADFQHFNRCPEEARSPCNQINWSQAFMNSSLGVEQIEGYARPFYHGQGTFSGIGTGPQILIPVQMASYALFERPLTSRPPSPVLKKGFRPEIDPMLHKNRLVGDEWYRSQVKLFEGLPKIEEIEEPPQEQPFIREISLPRHKARLLEDEWYREKCAIMGID